MGTPAAAIGDPADLLHVQVHHVTGPVCIDLPGLAVALSAWVDEPPSAETELGQVAGDGAAVDRESELDEFVGDSRSEEHTSELQSRGHLVCRLLLEKKNIRLDTQTHHIGK